MSLDTLGRSAGRSLRQVAAGDVDAALMLERLSRQSRNKSRRDAALLVAALGIVAAVGWLLVRPVDEASTLPVSPNVDEPVAINFDRCGAIPDPCKAVPGGSYLLPLKVPFTASIPDGWSVRGLSQWTAGRWVGLDADIVSDDGPGLSVVMNPRGSKPQQGRARDHSAGKTGHTLATWVASRSYLEPTQVVDTTVAGYRAWQVDVRLRDGVYPTFTCLPEILSCVPMILLPYGNDATGIAPGQVGRMLFLDLPDGQTVWVYAWDGGGETAGNLEAILKETQPIIDSIQFEVDQ